VRFGYYFALPIALLSGFVASELIRSTAGAPRLRKLAAAVAVVGLVLAPSSLRSWRAAPGFRGPSPAWHEVLAWLRRETPEPFDSPRAYFAGGRDEKAAYSVLAWWDYGYWILREGRRVPVDNPTQRGAASAARMLLAQDDGGLSECFGRLRCRYAIVDADLLLLRPAGRGLSSGKFEALVARAEEPERRFTERVWLAAGQGPLAETVIFRPDYFRALAVHLYLYGSQAVEPGPVWMVRFGAPDPPLAGDLRTVVEARRFASYDLAMQFQAPAEQATAPAEPATAQAEQATAQAEQAPTPAEQAPTQAEQAQVQPGSYEIVSFDPFATCVPLAALSHFRPVFDSPTPAGLARGHLLPAIRVFAIDPP
jgi:AglB core domain